MANIEEDMRDSKSFALRAGSILSAAARNADKVATQSGDGRVAVRIIALQIDDPRPNHAGAAKPSSASCASLQPVARPATPFKTICAQIRYADL